MNNGALKTVLYANGDFNFENEIGAVITHKDFFEAVGDDNYSFSLASSDDGTLLIIDFLSQMESYEQNQIYALNLDYGIVTQVMCYENGSLIYSLVTNSLSDSIDISLSVPESFLEFYNKILLRTASSEE